MDPISLTGTPYRSKMYFSAKSCVNEDGVVPVCKVGGAGPPGLADTVLRTASKRSLREPVAVAIV